MRTEIQALILVSLLGAALPVRAAMISSRPESATIYRDGYAVLEERLDRLEPGAAIRLPADTDLASIEVFRDGKRLDSVQLEEITEDKETVEKTVVRGEVVLEKPSKTKQRVGYLLRPGTIGASAGENLLLRYGCQGIGWEPRLSVEILDGERVSVTLAAQVNNGALDLSDCRIQLASGAGQLPSRLYFARQSYAGNQYARSADLLYQMGAHTVLKDRTTLLTVRTAQSRYREKLIWHTDSRDWVRVVLLVDNPFPEPICPAPVGLYRGGVLLGQDAAEFVAPTAPLVVDAGHAPEIEVERSVETSENLANRARPFTHDTKFRVNNRGHRTVRLEVAMPKKFGSQHKTIYRFGRQPDRRPGELFIWELELKKGQAEVIALSFDSEFPQFPGYEAYEKARYEMMH